MRMLSQRLPTQAIAEARVITWPRYHSHGERRPPPSMETCARPKIMNASIHNFTSGQQKKPYPKRASTSRNPKKSRLTRSHTQPYKLYLNSKIEIYKSNLDMNNFISSSQRMMHLQKHVHQPWKICLRCDANRAAGVAGQW